MVRLTGRAPERAPRLPGAARDRARARPGAPVPARLRAARARRLRLRVGAHARPSAEPLGVLPPAARCRPLDRARPHADRAAAGLAVRRAPALARRRADLPALAQLRGTARAMFAIWLAWRPLYVQCATAFLGDVVRRGAPVPRLPGRPAVARRARRPAARRDAHPRARRPARRPRHGAAPVRRQPGRGRAVAARRLLAARRADGVARRGRAGRPWRSSTRSRCTSRSSTSASTT